MNLLEILQIVAFSKKTGTLRVEGPLASGAILFRRGRVLSALASDSASENSLVKALTAPPLDASRLALLDDLSRTTLRELSRLREGRFEFQLMNELPRLWEGLDVSPILDTEGLNPQALMLELAHELDEARKDTRLLLECSDLPESTSTSTLPLPLPSPSPSPSASPVPSPFSGRPLAGPGARWSSELTVVVVDDERPVVEAARAELADTGATLESAGEAGEAIEILGRLTRSGRRLVLVTDLAMPSSSGTSFDGGFEIVERLKDLDATAPVILMVESLSSEARTRAKELGIRNVAFKPALTKLDLEEYRSDLGGFARVLRREIGDLVGLAGTRDRSPAAAGPEDDVILDFLKTMTEQLTSPANKVARMVLRVASKYAERAILFLVKESRARGLAGVHEGRSTASVTERVRALSYELQKVPAFAEAVYSREPVRVEDRTDLWPEGIEPGAARELAVFPLLHLHEVLAIVYCDNPESGARLGKLAGLQLFLAQAGMALENASLHRKLRSLEQRYSLENQGPLTQELTPAAEKDPFP